MARKKRPYDPSRDNPLLDNAALLIAGSIGAVGVGYVAYKISQPSVPSTVKSNSTKTPPAKSTASKTPLAGGTTPLKFIPTTTPPVTTSDPATTTPAATIMKPGQVLVPGNSLISPSGQYEFIFQTDGNLVLYQGSPGSYTNAVWNTDTQGKGSTTVIMQTDGNCVLYVGAAAAWATNTVNNPGAYLAIQDNGILVVYIAANLISYNSYNALWSSNWPQ